MKKWMMFCDDCTAGLEIEVPEDLSLGEAHILKEDGQFKYYCETHKDKVDKKIKYSGVGKRINNG